MVSPYKDRQKSSHLVSANPQPAQSLMAYSNYIQRAVPISQFSYFLKFALFSPHSWII